MELTLDQINRIQEDLSSVGVGDEVGRSLLDHICCQIEDSKSQAFEDAYECALKSFGTNGLLQTQVNINLVLINKKEEKMKKSMFILGYISTVLIIMGLLFRVQHWPGAAMMYILGSLILVFGVLPMLFTRMYKKSIA